MTTDRRFVMAAAVLCALAAPRDVAAAPTSPAPPNSLRDTGLYVSGSMTRIRPANLAFTPQYGLWSDGASKRRWLWLPPGKAIDASDPDAWQFPRGSKLWKEFSIGRAIETRLIERLANGSWRFATYVWNADGSDARLADVNGSLLAVDGAAGGRYEIPARADCIACHQDAAQPVLGVGALQWSADRDPLALHAGPAEAAATDLRALVDRGWLRGLPQHLLDEPPRIAAATPTERAALGYLHANCGHCHNDSADPAPVKLQLAQKVADAQTSRQRVLRSLIDAPSRFRAPGAAQRLPLIAAGKPASSVLLHRMNTRNPLQQMPPTGSRQTDAAALALIERWINHDLSSTKEP